MEKDNRLINIYLKIHNKRPITTDDLRYLAQFDPECFEKTCKNVVYNLPESKPIMEPIASEPREPQPHSPERPGFPAVLENLKHIEANSFLFANIDAEKVKNLLGNLYMELLFPHNDKDMFLGVPDQTQTSTFDKRA